MTHFLSDIKETKTKKKKSKPICVSLASIQFSLSQVLHFFTHGNNNEQKKNKTNNEYAENSKQS